MKLQNVHGLPARMFFDQRPSSEPGLKRALWRIQIYVSARERFRGMRQGVPALSAQFERPYAASVFCFVTRRREIQYTIYPAKLTPSTP